MQGSPVAGPGSGDAGTGGVPLGSPAGSACIVCCLGGVWGRQRTRRGDHEGVANGWLRVGATDLSVHRSSGAVQFAVGDDDAHTSRHILSCCVCSRGGGGDMIKVRFMKSCNRVCDR